MASTVVLLIGGACGSSGKSVGAVRITLTVAPADVGCVEVTAAGAAKTVARLFLTTGGASTDVMMQGLPLGEVRFSGMAFSTVCAEIDRSAPSFTGDPVTATLRAGEIAAVKLILRRPGRASISIDFDDPDGDGAPPDGGAPRPDGGGDAPDGAGPSDGALPRILFADKFEDGVLPGAWQLWRRSFVESGGRLLVADSARPGFNYGHFGNGRGAMAVTHVGDQSWTDYRVDLDLEITDSGSFNPHGAPPCWHTAVLYFRAAALKESWNEPSSTHYMISMSPSHCGDERTKEVNLSSVHDFYLSGTGCCNAVGTQRALLSLKSDALVDGPNHYTIEVVGKRITLWINGVLVFDYVDDQVPHPPGVSPITYGGIGVQWAFETMGWLDNVVVTDLR